MTADNYALVPGGDGWEFAFLTQGVWDEWKKDIIRIEEESFSASLCNTEEDLQKVINSPTGLFLAIRLVSSEIAAYLAADLLEEFMDVRVSRRIRTLISEKPSTLSQWPLIEDGSRKAWGSPSRKSP